MDYHKQEKKKEKETGVVYILAQPASLFFSWFLFRPLVLMSWLHWNLQSWQHDGTIQNNYWIRISSADEENDYQSIKIHNQNRKLGLHQDVTNIHKKTQKQKTLTFWKT